MDFNTKKLFKKQSQLYYEIHSSVNFLYFLIILTCK